LRTTQIQKDLKYKRQKLKTYFDFDNAWVVLSI